MTTAPLIILHFRFSRSPTETVRYTNLLINQNTIKTPSNLKVSKNLSNSVENWHKQTY